MNIYDEVVNISPQRIELMLNDIANNDVIEWTYTEQKILIIALKLVKEVQREQMEICEKAIKDLTNFLAHSLSSKMKGVKND